MPHQEDHMLKLQEYLVTSNVPMKHALAIFERLEPLIEIMYDLGYTTVYPLHSAPPLRETVAKLEATKHKHIKDPYDH